MVSIADVVRDTQSAAVSTFKARLTQMLFPSMGSWSPWVLNSPGKVNYERKVDARGASTVASVTNWTRNNFPEAPLIVESIGKGNNPDEQQPDHPLVQLLRRPNPWYSGSLLWSATIPDWLMGNAYWIIAPSKSGRPVELWYAPAGSIEPIWPKNDNSVFISHYEYTVGNEKLDIEPANVIHFRLGIDPNNTRKGLSPLGSLFRELFTDNEAADWTASLLANGAVPGLIIAPDNERVQIDIKQAEVMKQLAMQKFGGSKRGEPMVLTHAAKVSQASWNPQQMNLKDIRRIPEERVTAVFGLPAVVCGLGAGLDRSTFANMAEAREAAYESFLIPHKGLLADELNVQLLPRFSDPQRFRVGWDYSRVRVLQEDQDKAHTRARENWKAGGMMLDEFREAIGLPALGGDTGKLFAVPMSVTYLPADELYQEPQEVPAALEAFQGGEPPLALPSGRAPNEPDLPDSEANDEDGEVGASSGPKVAGGLPTSSKPRRVPDLRAV